MPEVGFAATKTIEVEVIDEIIKIQDIHVKGEDQLSVYVTASLQLETSFTPEVVTYTTLNGFSENTRNRNRFGKWVDKRKLLRGRHESE